MTLMTTRYLVFQPLTSKITYISNHSFDEAITNINFHDLPVSLATPLNVISSMTVGSERPFALMANKMMRYDVPASRLSMKNKTGERCSGKMGKREERNQITNSCSNSLHAYININSSGIRTGMLRLRASLKCGISTSSRMNPCGKPPSKPSMHSTCSESDDWLEIVQFCRANGRPE